MRGGGGGMTLSMQTSGKRKTRELYQCQIKRIWEQTQKSPGPERGLHSDKRSTRQKGVASICILQVNLKYVPNKRAASCGKENWKLKEHTNPSRVETSFRPAQQLVDPARRECHARAWVWLRFTESAPRWSRRDVARSAEYLPRWAIRYRKVQSPKKFKRIEMYSLATMCRFPCFVRHLGSNCWSHSPGVLFPLTSRAWTCDPHLGLWPRNVRPSGGLVCSVAACPAPGAAFCHTVQLRVRVTQIEQSYRAGVSLTSSSSEYCNGHTIDSSAFSNRVI